MTTNQLELKKLNIEQSKAQETARSNKENEAIKWRQTSISEDTLAETVVNNLRNYKINVDKNQIQRLANDQMNNREANKLAATIQDNLANQRLTLQKNIETERNNKVKEQLEQELNDIKRMDSLLTAAKASGKTPTAILISWILNQLNTQGYAGKAVPGEVINQITDWMTNEATGEVMKDDGSVDRTKRSYKGVVYDSVQDPTRRQTNKVTINKYKKYDDPIGPELQSKGIINSTRKQSSNIISNRREDNLNETPLDYSNSYGPAKEDTKIKSDSKNYGPGYGISYPSATAGGTDYHVSGGLKSSATIVAPGANQY